MLQLETSIWVISMYRESQSLVLATCLCAWQWFGPIIWQSPSPGASLLQGRAVLAQWFNQPWWSGSYDSCASWTDWLWPWTGDSSLSGPQRGLIRVKRIKKPHLLLSSLKLRCLWSAQHSTSHIMTVIIWNVTLNYYSLKWLWTLLPSLFHHSDLVFRWMGLCLFLNLGLELLGPPPKEILVITIFLQVHWDVILHTIKFTHCIQPGHVVNVHSCGSCTT